MIFEDQIVVRGIFGLTMCLEVQRADIRICLIVPTLTIFVSGSSSFQQADHADFAELGNSEVNN